MANGKVAINTDIVNATLSYIVNSCAIVEGDISSKIPGNFQPLADLGLLPTSLTKIQEQIKLVVSVHKDLITQISSHLEDVAKTEDDLSNEFDSDTGRRDDSRNTDSQEGSDTSFDEVEDGKQITADKLVEYIPNLDSDSKLLLIKLLDTNKKKETKLIDLLFNTSKSEELFVLLRQIFKDNSELTNVSIEDYKKVQKILLDTILKENIPYKELTDNSILIAKEYLIDISKMNNIDTSDLILDSKYQNLLKTSLIKLYDGNDIEGVSETVINNFRAYIDRVSKENNIKADELLTNNIGLIL